MWESVRRYVWLALGSVFLTFVGWRFNVAAASWLAPVFLIRFFRDEKRWVVTLLAIPLLAIASFIQLNGGWDLEPWMAYLFSVLRPAAFVAGLYADRYLHKRLPSFAATLVFPSVYLAVDYAISFTPLGNIMSMSATQFVFPAVLQLASITGIWGIGFLMGWIAACFNTLWERGFDLAKSARIAVTASVVLAAVLVFGSFRFSLARAGSPTVRIGSVAIEHPRDYWNWIDAGTPRDLIDGYRGELRTIEDRLFQESDRAVAAGAKIVFWSEGNCVLTEDEEVVFMDKARHFAVDNGVYFAPAVLVLRYGQTLSDNKLVMIQPDGSVAFTYVKTKSWYPTGSDGILKSVDTPYGRIAAAICFDMDFPMFVNALGRMKTDIVLVPSYDTERIRPYHTEVGLTRAVENGFSAVRQTNAGLSMAVDPMGRVLSRQDFFYTSERLMIADVPTSRLRTVYAVLGDWFAWAGIALALGLAAAGAVRGRASRAT